MDKPQRTPEAEDQIRTAREMPANWQSGTGAGRGPNAAPITEHNRDAERPAPAHPGAPSKLPGYGGGQ
jgi:hypothetical protein